MIRRAVLIAALLAPAAALAAPITIPSACTFKADGAGAVTRKCAEKYADVISVKDFKGSDGLAAQGDGNHDDTEAIQAAVTASAGGTVFFPRPSVSYKVTGTINVSVAGTTLRGNDSKIFMAFAVSSPASGILFNVTASNVTFDSLWIDSTGTAVTTTTNKYVIKFVGTSGTHLANSVVRNCKFTNLAWEDTILTVVGTHAIYATFADLSVFEGNTFDNLGGAAIFTNQLDGLKVLHNNINNTGWYSIQLQALVTNALIDGNRITGTLPGSRVWGGSINLMSNGTATVGEGLGRDSKVRITNNYISGVHSYTAAVHIESSSYVEFEHNRLENITLTSAADMLARYGQVTPFYPDGSSPVYVRPYTRVVVGSPDVDEGSCDHIFITDNTLIAVGTNAIGIFADNQHKTGITTLADTLSIVGNRVLSIDTNNTFKTAIAVHGQDGGWKNVLIDHNHVSGAPTDANPVPGLIGIIGNVGHEVTDATITVNTVEYIGTPSTSTHLGIGIGANTQRVYVNGNPVRNCWQGIRILAATATPVYIGINTFFGSGSSDYLFSGPPSIATSPSTRFGSLFVASRGSALVATTVAATVSAGEYRVSFTGRTITSGTGTTATVSIIWTDEGGAKTFTSATFALNAVDVTGQVNGTLFVHATVSSNIQASVAGTFGTSLYALSATVEKLN